MGSDRPASFSLILNANQNAKKKDPRFSLLYPLHTRCGVCSHGVKTGAAAVFTAECSHSFHFPCIAARAATATALACPVCAAPWRQAPFINTYKRTATTFKLDDNASPRHHKRKAYDDDEPLQPPKAAAAAFNPIPEDDVAEAEFRGFFPPRPRTGLAVTLAPEAALVSSGRRHGKYVVAVRVKAPGLRSSPSTRAPIDLVTVLDVSQGMMGDKLQMLKRGMRLVIASLGPADRLAIVAFSGAAKRLLPLRRMTRQGQRSARQIVDRLVVCAAAQGQEQAQSVCVGDALRKATKVLEDRRDRNPVATVMLLSDTQQQQDARKPGAVRRPPAAPPATRFTHVEIPIGPGEEPARSALVAEEDQVGDGAFAEHAFAKCLGGLVSVVMQEVQLELAFSMGEITAVYSCGSGQQAVALGGGGGGGAVVSVALGEMYAEEERELLVELRAPMSLSHPHSLSARCSYRDPASQETVRGAEQLLLLPALDGGSSSRRLHDLFVATRAVAESRRLAELNDYATAIHLLSSARALVLQSPPGQQQQELVGSLDTELSDMRWRRGQQQPQPRTPTSAGRRRGEAEETPLTPTSAWRAAEQLAKVAIMRKSMNRVSDLHGFENARF
ncbi:E3 ubiquitin-protein ligase WAV3 isoform X2 [Oryza brachyantha]|uniref:E3 ubiquitin-protein ligase WAV3 isoform X2 n=1 Tax=Oryza brachyantha TaxID=4533 RepID=UPI001ADD0BB7|nr:E3 ubiquitin-protein ligase WAV3 isoform X2 [Oryza brachyantha]